MIYSLLFVRFGIAYTTKHFSEKYYQSWIDDFHLLLFTLSQGIWTTISRFFLNSHQTKSKQASRIMTKAFFGVLCRNFRALSYPHTHSSEGSLWFFTCTMFFLLQILPLRLVFSFRDEILCILYLISGGLMGFFWDSFVITGRISFSFHSRKTRFESRRSKSSTKCSNALIPFWIYMKIYIVLGISISKASFFFARQHFLIFNLAFIVFGIYRRWEEASESARRRQLINAFFVIKIYFSHN